MFYARAFHNLLLWISAPDFDSVPNLALDDWKSSGDGAFSFYASNSDEFLDKQNTNIVIKIISDGSQAWLKAIGLLLFEQAKIESIKKPKPDKPGPLGTVHFNMEGIDRRVRNALEELSFNERGRSHNYCLEEIATAMASLSIEDWASLLDSKGKDKTKIAARIKNVFFRTGGMIEAPQALIDYCNNSSS